MNTTGGVLSHLSLLADLPQPPTLERAVQQAREALLNGGDLRKAVEDLLLWVDATPNPTELEAIKSASLNPDDLIVMAGAAMEAGGQVARTPNGDVILQNFHVAVPMDAVNYSRVLDANGQPRPPFAGSLPFLTFRWLVPRRCFRQQDLQ